MVLQRLLDGDEVLQAFGHLEPFDVEVAGVEEIIAPLVAIEFGFCLSDLVVMVRETKVYTTGMDI